MAYTWEEVMFGIDVKNEQARKAEHQRKVEEMAADETSAAGWWSLGLSILGGAIFGPAGYYAGKQAGSFIADIKHPWEEMEMEEGKFYTKEAEKFNRTLKKEAEDQTSGQIINAVMDIGKMYVASGGLTAEPGEWNPFTFGSGGAEGGEWSLLGKGQGPIDVTSLNEDELYRQGYNLVPGTSTTVPSADYVPSLFSGGVSEGIGRGYKMWSQDQAIQSGTDLTRLWLESGKEEDKRAS